MLGRICSYRRQYDRGIIITMDSITLKNFRCFGDEQTACLAPLTLLVGDNSTGKTSFLAMVRTLQSLITYSQPPDFKEAPYDLGSFDEIAHIKDGRGTQADTFEAGFDAEFPIEMSDGENSVPYHFDVIFGKQGTAPVPIRRRFAFGNVWIEHVSEEGKPHMLRVGTSRGVWERHVPELFHGMTNTSSILNEASGFLLIALFTESTVTERKDFIPISGHTTISSEDMEELRNVMAYSVSMTVATRLFASAPVRSKPRRTYDPARLAMDPEGDYIPMYLADMYSNDRSAWVSTKRRLEEFGQASGLFDEISIRRLGDKGSEPFQVRARKFGGGLKGPRHNLIDMGYGVSQVLPLVTELLSDTVREELRSLFLLQQPEVHLHPSAQAALGSLFCQVAGFGCQIIVETHSDHLLDRIRMDIRDGIGNLKHDDVSVLYFEREALNVRIHSLGIDEEGNVVGAPDSYRRFFMAETRRDLGF